MSRDTSVFQDNILSLIIRYNFLKTDRPTWKCEWPDRSEVYIKRRETSGRMKYDKTYPPLPATLAPSHSLLNVFPLFSPFATKISEVLPLFRREIKPARQSLLSWTNRDVYREPFWNVHRAWPRNVSKTNKNNYERFEQISTCCHRMIHANLLFYSVE